MDLLFKCIPHGWYLSVDFLLYLITPLLVYPTWKFGWKFLWILPLLSLLSSVYIFCLVMIYEITYNFGSFEKFLFYLQWIYYPLQARWGSWFIGEGIFQLYQHKINILFHETGITLGYILHQQKQMKIHLNLYFNMCMWILSLGTLIGITMGAQILRSPAHNVPLIAHAFYMSLLSNAWALALAWIIFSIFNGSGGLIKWFLSHQMWQPIARMGLSLYLLSNMFQQYIIMISRERIYFSEVHTLHAFLGDFVASVMIAVVGYMAFETPFTAIEGYVYEKFFKRNKTQ